MTAIADAIYARLSGDAALAGLVGQYGTAPAIFVGDVLPAEVLPDQHGPLVLVPDGKQSDFDTGVNVRLIGLNVRMYGVSSQALEAVGIKVRQLLHRWSAAVDHGKVVTTQASGPTFAPTDNPAYQGRIVNVTLTMQEQ